MRFLPRDSAATIETAPSHRARAALAVWALAWVLGACGAAVMPTDVPTASDALVSDNTLADIAARDDVASDVATLDASFTDARDMDATDATDATDSATRADADAAPLTGWGGCRLDPPAPGDAGACAAPNVACGDRCTNLNDDPNNCGACGVRCCGYWCIFGVCGTEGPPGTYACPPHEPPTPCCTGPVPVQISTDPRHCGACGRSCEPGQVCDRGECR